MDDISIMLDEVFDEMDSSVRVNKIYHYIKGDNFENIIKEDGIHLWFTDYRCMNDSSEGDNIINIFKDICEMKYNKEVQFYKNIASIIKKIDENKYISDISGICYLACFSVTHDEINMWNSYIKDSKNNGFNIGFSTSYLKTYKPENGKIKLLKVIYEDGEKRKRIKDFLKNLSKEDITDAQIEERVIKKIDRLKFVFKNFCYKNENEVRLVYIPGKNNFSGKKYRINCGVLAGYYELILPKKIIKAITIGPLGQDNISHISIRSLLEERGYDINISQISTSKIPFRA